MISDSLANVGRLFAKGKRYEAGLSFLLRGDLASIKAGRHEIAGDDAFALVLDYETHPFNPGGWEAHRRYNDVQLLIHGNELYSIAPVSSLMVKTPYDGSKDVEVLSGEGAAVHFPKNRFVIFEPADAHQPGIAVGAPERVRKIVVKILV